jgi:hypothetical protein
MISTLFGADQFINQWVRSHDLFILCFKLDGPLFLEQLSVRSVLPVELLKDLFLFIQRFLQNLLIGCHEDCLHLLLL